mgnify:CR=1 FL=1
MEFRATTGALENVGSMVLGFGRIRGKLLLVTSRAMRDPRGNVYAVVNFRTFSSKRFE